MMEAEKCCETEFIDCILSGKGQKSNWNVKIFFK
jgi:hypothetical protein